ncbi:MAG TPA: hypothetical protein VF765_31180 [Polyangiaceae bacterium]
MNHKPLKDLEAIFWLRFCDAGRTQLVVGHKYAAALMSSAVVESIADEMRIPWKAFAIDLPSDLLHTEELAFHRITVGVYEGLDFGCVMTIWGTRRSTGDTISFIRVASDPMTLFFATDVDVLGEPQPDLDVKERAMRLAIRLTTGLLYTMQHTVNFRTREYPAKPLASGREGPPPHRVYVVGKPMALDCRQSVHAYLAGRGHTPSVQSIVRGHYKRQVVGAGRIGRKVVWIEPYWRGPEDAPILSRDRIVGARVEDLLTGEGRS